MALRRNSRTIERKRIDELRPPAVSIQNHPPKQIGKAREFLQTFDQIPIIYASADGEILGGEEIWRALKAIGATEADVLVVNDKSPAELDQIRVGLARIPLDARWDDQNVRIVLEGLEIAGLDLNLTGFDPPELDGYLNLDAPQAGVEESGADLPPLGKTAVASRDSIWMLGDHCVGCGDATDLSFTKRVLRGGEADVCFVDPPYNLKVDGVISGRGRHHHREFEQGAGELSDEQYFELLRNSLAVIKACSRPSALAYVCIDWRHMLEMLAAARACAMPVYQIAVWIKANAGLGGIYRNQHEFVCVFRTGDEAPLDNVELGRRGRNRSNVWRYAGMSSFGKQRDELGFHPTVKPVAMIADALRDTTKRGALVLDTFLGSGSTLMAADETARRCCGVELDPLYVDVVIRRWQNTTGRAAILLETGETFDSLSQGLLLAKEPEPGDGE